MSRAAAKNQRTPEIELSPVLPVRGQGGVMALCAIILFLFALAVGYFVLRLPDATTSGSGFSIQRAVFTVTNAATLTGFQQSIAVNQYSTIGKACIISLTVIGTLVALIAGGLAVVRLAGMRFSPGQVIVGTLTWYIVCVFVGTALLADPTRSIPTAAAQAASAFGNSGIILGTLPGILDWRSHAVLMILALIGGLSIPVLLDLTGALFGHHKTTTHTRVVVHMTALLYLLGFVACVPWGDSSMTWPAALATGSAAAIDARTAGLPLFSVTALTRFTQWLIIALMMVGAASGSAAGGLKLTTIFELFRGTGRALRRQLPGRLFGIALAWLGLYLAILAGTLLALLAFQPELPADRLLFISASAVSCVGLSHDPISMAGGGLIVLSIAMLLGRLVPLAVLWWAATTTPDADLAIG